MTTTKDDEIRAALEELRKEYFAELPDLLGALSLALATAKQSGTPKICVWLFPKRTRSKVLRVRTVLPTSANKRA